MRPAPGPRRPEGPARGASIDELPEDNHQAGSRPKRPLAAAVGQSLASPAGARRHASASQRRLATSERPLAGAGAQPPAQCHASLEPVYEPKHYLANCAPIQFIPMAGAETSAGAAPRARAQAGASVVARHQCSLPLAAGCALAEGAPGGRAQPEVGARPAGCARLAAGSFQVAPATGGHQQARAGYAHHWHIIPKHYPGLCPANCCPLAVAANEQQPGGARAAPHRLALRRYSTSVIQLARHPLARPGAPGRRLSVLPSGAPAPLVLVQQQSAPLASSKRQQQHAASSRAFAHYHHQDHQQPGDTCAGGQQQDASPASGQGASARRHTLAVVANCGR